MNTKRMKATRKMVLVLTLLFVATFSVSCSGNSKFGNKPETEDSVSQNAYYNRAEGASIAPAVNGSPQDAPLGMPVAKAFPAGTVSEDDVKIKKDQAIEIAKTMLDDPSGYVAGNTFLYPKYGIYGASGAIWTIDFSKADAQYSNVNVTIDADSGKITGFNCWDADSGQHGGKEPMSREEAIVIAENMLADIFGISIGNYELQKDYSYAYDLRMPEYGGSSVHSFNYTRVVNGVLFPFETVSISIDGVGGKLRSFYHNDSQFDFSTLPSKDSAITPEQALAQYRKAVNMTLQYITLYQEQPKAVLVYAPTQYLYMLDAVSGKPINYDGLPYDLPAYASSQLIPMNPGAPIESKAISGKEAEALAEKYRKLAESLYGITFENAESASDIYRQTNDGIWNGSWYKYDEKYSYSFYISINTKTGHIVNLGVSKYENGGIMPMEAGKGNAVTGIAVPPEPNTSPVMDGAQKPEVAQSSPAQEPAIRIAPDYVQEPVNERFDWDAGKAKALEFIKEMLPDTYGFYADASHEQPALSDDIIKYTREHTYMFVRMVNSIPYRENTINVSVDRETGEIRNLYYSWNDMEFKSPDGLIGEKKAEDIYFGDMEAKLAYHLVTSYDYNTGMVTDVKPILVYNFSSKRGPYASNQFVDAFTGEFTGYDYMLMRDSISSSYAK